MIEDTLKIFSSFKKTYSLPFQYQIPHYTQKYIDTTPLTKRFLKFFRRYLYMFFNNHISLEIDKIEQKHNSILWINLSAPSLGDSLMDLSSRVLLQDKNIDLFTDIKNAHIYKNDAIFQNILTNPKDIDKNKYDLVIIDSYGTKSLKIKFKYLRNLPYIGMYGHYNGPEVNRVLYSFHRMNQLLGYIKQEEEINSTAKAIMHISNSDIKFVENLSLPKEYITLAVGGEWDYRTYNQWEIVIKHILTENPNENIVLIGSNNAKDICHQLILKFNSTNIIDAVAKYSFCQTAQIIQNSKVLLCCDGGLMHAANSVGTTIIPLFARLTPQMQLTTTIRAYPLYDKLNVNNILPQQICENFNRYKEEAK